MVEKHDLIDIPPDETTLISAAVREIVFGHFAANTLDAVSILIRCLHPYDRNFFNCYQAPSAFDPGTFPVSESGRASTKVSEESRLLSQEPMNDGLFAKYGQSCWKSIRKAYKQ